MKITLSIVVCWSPTLICFTVLQLHLEWWKIATDWKHRRKRRVEVEQGRRGRRKMGSDKRERKAIQITVLNLITHRKWPQDSWKQLGNSSAEVTDVQIWIPVFCLMVLLFILSECYQWLDAHHAITHKRLIPRTDLYLRLDGDFSNPYPEKQLNYTRKRKIACTSKSLYKNDKLSASADHKTVYLNLILYR